MFNKIRDATPSHHPQVIIEGSHTMARAREGSATQKEWHTQLELLEMMQKMDLVAVSQR